ncbi:MAG: signal peptidase I [Anaerolineae bacterium]|nr:signal peptidase I [Anaerolineae bacterium]
MNSEIQQPEVDTGEQVNDVPGLWGRIRPLLREVLETVLLALLVWAGIAIFIPPYEASGSSMEPTVLDGQQVLASRAAYWFGMPRRGDIVVLRSPEDLSTVLVKRVIALPGEEVAVRNDTVYIDGVRLDEPYLEASGPSFDDRTWTVPDDKVFVMGDNRLPSRDSRTWGPVNKETIIGKAWLIYWPVNAWGLIPHYRHPDPLPVVEEEEAPVTVEAGPTPSPAEVIPTPLLLTETVYSPTPAPSEPVVGTVQVMTFMYSANSFDSSILARLHVNTSILVMGRDRGSDWLYCHEPDSGIEGWVWTGTVELPVPVSTLTVVE